MDKKIYSEIPKPPKAIGISRRLLFTIVGGLLLILILFFIFLNRYAPRPIKNQSIEITKGSSESAISLIERINGQKHKPMLVDLKDQPINPKTINDFGSPADTRKEPLSQNDFKEASNASISVYHDASDSERSSTPTLPYQNLSSPLKSPIDVTHSPDTYAQQNLQSEKVAFLQSNSSIKKNTIQSQLQNPLSPFQINAGTIIPANLVTPINSDLPGHIIAKVRRNVYDTATGNYLLIPQGSTLLGMYDSQVAYGQSRVLIVWSRLIFPDASSFDLQGMPGADLSGIAGLSDQIDNHYFRIFSSALMFSLFGAAGQLSQPQSSNSQLTSQQIIYGAIGQQMGQTATQLVAKNMNIQPTLKIRPGVDFNVLLTRDMVLQAPYSIK